MLSTLPAVGRLSGLAAPGPVPLPMPTTQLLPAPPFRVTLRSAASVPALFVPGLSVAPALVPRVTSPLGPPTVPVPLSTDPLLISTGPLPVAEPVVPLLAASVPPVTIVPPE